MSNDGWEADSRPTRLVEPYPVDDCRAFNADECTFEDFDQPCPSIDCEARHALATRCHDEHGELGRYGLGRDISGRCLMPALTFEDFWFRTAVRSRILLMDCSHKPRGSTRSFEQNKERISLMLASLDGRIGEVLVRDMFHNFHAPELFDIFTMDFTGCRPVKLEDTYDWTSLDQDAPTYHYFFCTYDGHSDCTRTSRTPRGQSKNDTSFKIGLDSMDQKQAAKLQARKPCLRSRSNRADKAPAFESVGSNDANASDDSLERRLQKLPQEMFDGIKKTLLDVTLGPRQTCLETGKLHPNVLRAFNREFYYQTRKTWLSSKLWTMYSNHPLRDETGRLAPISIPRQLREEARQLSITFDWSGLCPGCIAWLDSHYFKHENYPVHWLPHENKDYSLQNMFDIAVAYLEDVNAANTEILEAWVQELSVIGQLSLDLLILDTRGAYNYSGEFIGLDVVKRVLSLYWHGVGMFVVKAPNKALEEEILETLQSS